jgi:hypothetical protein
MSAWDLKSYDQKWFPVKIRNSATNDISEFSVLVLSYPCSQDAGCWNALLRFTNSPKARWVVYVGEPRSHCCGDADMWQHLCKHWRVVITQPIEGGLPGSYNYIMAFVKRRNDEQSEWCNSEQQECNAPVTCDASQNCPQNQTNYARDFVEYCGDHRTLAATN